MHDDRDTRRQANKIQDELNRKRLSRRAFLDRLKLLGIGFGAASLLGIKDSDANTQPDTVARLKSTHPALKEIIDEAHQDLEDLQAQYYRRCYTRFFRGGYRRFFFRRGYRRFYRRFYRRGYRRFYRRFR
ncbi:MAG: hypothetical protein M3248_04695 [Actinomycetota bacterium]|nr:hypothetical protein [Actinomycetota bacterium]